MAEEITPSGKFIKDGMSKFRALKAEEMAAIEAQKAAKAFIKRKADRIKAADSKSQTLIYNGFTFNNKVFSMSLEAQTNWAAIQANRANLTYPFEVSTKDGGSYSFANSEEVNTFYLAGFEFKANILAGGRILRANLNAATTNEELNAVVDNRT